MVRTIFFALYFWILLILTLVLLIPYGLLRLLRLKKAEEGFLRVVSQGWSRHVLRAAGARVRVTGAENVPETGKLCFVANHQGIADIPLVFGYVGRRLAIIAKKELGQVPLINIWISALGCVLIDRRSVHHAHEAIDQGIERIRNGLPMAIFPEGTRSRGPQLKPFRPGSLKLATRSGAVIVPISIDGSYRLLEERGLITPADVRLVIHPPIPTEGLSPEEQKGLAGRLEKIIERGLEH